MDLPHGRHRRGRSVDELPDVCLGARLDVHHDVAAGQSSLNGLLHRIRRRMTLPDAGRGRDADYHVGELAPSGLPHPQPAQLDAGAERGDRFARRGLRSGRGDVHQDVYVGADQPGGAGEDEHGDEERCHRVAVGMPGPHEQEARSRTATEPTRSLAKCSAFDASAALPVLRETRRERTARAASTTITIPIVMATTGPGVHRPRAPSPANCSIARKPMKRLARERNDASASAARCAGLPVAVLVGDVGRPARDPEGEEREQRGDEVRPRMHRLGHEPEAVRGWWGRP